MLMILCLYFYFTISFHFFLRLVPPFRTNDFGLSFLLTVIEHSNRFPCAPTKPKCSPDDSLGVLLVGAVDCQLKDEESLDEKQVFFQLRSEGP